MNTTKALQRMRGSTILAAVFLLALPLAAMACPNCKLSVEDTDAGSVQGVTGAVGNMAAGYAYSIYLMLSVPLVMATSLVFFIRRQVRMIDQQPPTEPPASV